jgi:hypothetical protein
MKAEMQPWRGLTAVCIASGPSLTPEDVDTVRLWREAGRGRVVVVNTSFRAAPWADALFAMDSKWWGIYHAEVKQEFHGTAYTTSSVAINFGVRRVTQVSHYRNSGAGAVALAAWLGASNVVLLGYDCQHDGVNTHWHGSHPRGLGDAVTVRLWPAKFAELARAVRVPVVNASRATALTCFPRMDLSECLEENWNAADRFATENRIP